MALDSSIFTTANQAHIEYHVEQLCDHNAHLLFLNGYRTHFNTWDRLLERLSGDVSVLLYNRLGIGRSSSPNEKQSGDIVLRDLRELLSDTGFAPPYIIVAHSLGGIFAELYARNYPNEIAGMLLIDAPHVEEIPYMKALKIPWPLKILNAIMHLGDKLRGRYAHSEDQEIEQTLASLKNAGAFPSIPLAVVSGAKKMPFVPEQFFQVHQEFQQKLLQLSPHSRQFICEHSLHFPQISEAARVEQIIRYIIAESAT